MARGNRRILVGMTLFAVPALFWTGSFTDGKSPAAGSAFASETADTGNAFGPSANGSPQPAILRAIAVHGDAPNAVHHAVGQPMLHPAPAPANGGSKQTASGEIRQTAGGEIRQTGGLLSELFGRRSEDRRATAPVPPAEAQREPVDWSGIPYHEANGKEKFAGGTPIRDPADHGGAEVPAQTASRAPRIIRNGASRTLDATRPNSAKSKPPVRVAERAPQANIPKPAPLADVSIEPPEVQRRSIDPLSRKSSSRRSGRRRITPLTESLVKNAEDPQPEADGPAAMDEDAQPTIASAETQKPQTTQPAATSNKAFPRVTRRSIRRAPADNASPEPESPALRRAMDKAQPTSRRLHAAQGTVDAPESPSDIVTPDVPYAASNSATPSGRPGRASQVPSRDVETYASAAGPGQRNPRNVAIKPRESEADLSSDETSGRRFEPMQPIADPASDVHAGSNHPQVSSVPGNRQSERRDRSERDAYDVGHYPNQAMIPPPAASPQGPPSGDRFAFRGDPPAINNGSRDVSIHPIAPEETTANPDGRNAAGVPTPAPGPHDDTAIASELPAIRVVTRGPREIMIRRTHQYEVQVENRGAIDVQGILVRTLVPDWAALEGQNVSTGEVQSTSDSDAERLSWTIDRLAAGQVARMFVRVKASRSGTFDLDIDWTLTPQKNVATIHVQEPRLELTIDGPEQVVYGQSQTYRVRVLNPGDGMAPNVVFTLSPESSTPQTQRIGDIPAGKEAQFEVELTAQDLGDLKIHGLATGDLDLQAEAAKSIRVAAARLEATFAGPELKYQGTTATYHLQIENRGTATSDSVVASLRLPTGVEYLGGIEPATQRGNQLSWVIESLEPNAVAEYEFRCTMAATGDQRFAFDCEGSAAGEATVAITTNVSAIADLVLSVDDPPAPAPVGNEVTYEIVIRNRGSKAAENVQAVAQFSHGIEPRRIEGHTGQVMTGQVMFDPIETIAAGQERRLRVIATADSAGHHRFRTEVRSGETVLVSEEATHYLKSQSERVSRRSSENDSR